MKFIAAILLLSASAFAISIPNCVGTSGMALLICVNQNRDSLEVWYGRDSVNAHKASLDSANLADNYTTTIGMNGALHDTAESVREEFGDSISTRPTASVVAGIVSGSLASYPTRIEMVDSLVSMRVFSRAVAGDSAEARASIALASAVDTIDQRLTNYPDNSTLSAFVSGALVPYLTINSGATKAQADSIARFRGGQDSVYTRSTVSDSLAASWPKQSGWTAATGTAHKGSFNANASLTVAGLGPILGITVPSYADIQTLVAAVEEARKRIKALEDALRNKERPGP